MNHYHSPGRRDAKVKRLNRIAGQVQGISRMVAEDRYCIDILTQMQAVKSALARADTVIVPAWRDPDEPPPPALLDALRATHARGARVVGL